MIINDLRPLFIYQKTKLVQRRLKRFILESHLKLNKQIISTDSLICPGILVDRSLYISF